MSQAIFFLFYSIEKIKHLNFTLFIMVWGFFKERSWLGGLKLAILKKVKHRLKKITYINTAFFVMAIIILGAQLA